MRPWQPRCRGDRRIRAPGGRPARRACRRRRSRSAISNSRGRSSATAWTRSPRAAPQRILALPGMLFAASHVKNDLPVGGQQLRRRPPRGRAALRARARDRAEAARRRGRPHRRRRAAAARAWCRARRHAAARRRPRHQRSRRQFQHRQGRAHAGGGDGLRLGRDRLQRRGLAAGRARPATRRCGWASGASSCFPISCSPASW